MTHKKQSERFIMNSFRQEGFWDKELLIDGQDNGKEPDFLLGLPNKSGKYELGVELVELFSDKNLNIKNQSAIKRRESLINKKILSLKKLHEKKSNAHLLVKFLSDPMLITSNEDFILMLIQKTKNLHILQQKKIFIGEQSLYVRALPDKKDYYKKWCHIPTLVGWVTKANPQIIQQVIDDKGKKLYSYQQTAEDIILLIHFNRINNSGRIDISEIHNHIFNSRFFKKIYLFDSINKQIVLLETLKMNQI